MRFIISSGTEELHTADTK